jgi:hypothetical protein
MSGPLWFMVVTALQALLTVICTNCPTFQKRIRRKNLYREGNKVIPRFAANSEKFNNE